MENEQQLFAKILIAREMLIETAEELGISNPTLMARVSGGDRYSDLSANLYFNGNSSEFGNVNVRTHLWNNEIYFSVNANDDVCGFGEISGTLQLETVSNPNEYFDKARQVVNDVFNAKERVMTAVRTGELPSGELPQN